MKSVFALSFIASASAFAPVAQRPSTSTRLAEQPENKEDLWTSSKDGPEKSQALPFAARPKILDGTLPADVGFDPFGFAGTDKASLAYMREAEIKHCRLAMLAVVGWVAAEILDKVRLRE